MSADGLPSIASVIDRYNLRAKKSLGQNFLCDLDLTRKIARASGELNGHTVIEIGPGPGGLTRALLLEGAQKVIAIERDDRALAALEEIATHYPGRVEIIAGNALKIDYAKLAATCQQPVKIVANLPYNIATPLLVGWLGGDQWPPFYQSLTLMFQREVAQRITAQNGDKAFGRLTLISQWRAQANMMFDIPPSAFTPAPKVTSTVVHITPHASLNTECDFKTLERVSAAAFGQRRKMLRSSLKSLGMAQDLLDAANIDGCKRAEELTIADFCHLAVAAKKLH